MTEKRRPFCDIPKEESLLATETGKEVIKTLVTRFADNSNPDKRYDLIFNSLTAAMLFFIKAAAEPDDFPQLLQLLHRNLTANLGIK